MFFLQPLEVEAVGLHIECSVSDGRFAVSSGEVRAHSVLIEKTTHCSGSVVSRVGWRRIDHAAMRGHTQTHSADVSAMYDGFDSVGIQYGPSYRTLMQAWGGGGGHAAVARLRARGAQQGTQVHPADLDDAGCARAAVATNATQSTAWLPFAVDEAQLEGTLGPLWAVRSSFHFPICVHLLISRFHAPCCR